MTAALPPIRPALNQPTDPAPNTSSPTHPFMPNARAHEAFRRNHHRALKTALKEPLNATRRHPLNSPIRIKRPLSTDTPDALS